MANKRLGGRPRLPKGIARTRARTIRLNPTEDKRIEKAARNAALSVQEFMRNAALKAADKEART